MGSTVARNRDYTIVNIYIRILVVCLEVKVQFAVM